MFRKMALYVLTLTLLPTIGNAYVIDINYTGVVSGASEPDFISGWFRVDFNDHPLIQGDRALLEHNYGSAYTSDLNDSFISSTLTDHGGYIPPTPTSISESVQVRNVPTNTTNTGDIYFDDYLTVYDSFHSITGTQDAFGNTSFTSGSHNLAIMITGPDFIDSYVLDDLDIYIDNAAQLTNSSGYIDVRSGTFNTVGEQTIEHSTGRTFDLTSVRVVSSVPEPSSLSIMFLGCIALMCRRKFSKTH